MTDRAQICSSFFRQIRVSGFCFTAVKMTLQTHKALRRTILKAHKGMMNALAAEAILPAAA